MEYTFPDREIRLRTAGSWVARPVGARIVVAHPREEQGLDPEYLPVSVYINVHQTSDSLEQLALKVMRPRVPVGYLEAKELELGSKKSLEFEWTDGILYIESSFIAVHDHRVLELTFAIDPSHRREMFAPQRTLRHEPGQFVDVDSILEGFEQAMRR